MMRAKLFDQPFFLLVLALSLVAFIIRAAEFLQIGSVFPSVFIASAIVMMCSAYLLGGDTWFRRAVMVWGGILVLYGMLRILMVGMVQAGLIDSAHAVDAASLIYMMLSAVYIAVGIYMLRKPSVSS